MRRDLKKIVVFVLSSVIFMKATMPAFAEEIEQTDVEGVGKIEGIVKPDVYQVVLPTDINGIFNFILDPQKLIEKTNAIAYGGKNFEKGSTVFFRRLDGRAAEDYSSSSDHVTIINHSTIPVDVHISISLESLGNIKMTGDREFTNDTSPSLYLALVDGEHIVPIGMGDSYIHTTIPAAPEAAFEYNYDQEHGEYTYGLKGDVSDVEFPEYSFQIIGAANEKGDWGALGKIDPLVNVTWKVTPGQTLDLAEENSSVSNQILEQISDENEVVSGDTDKNEDSTQNKKIDSIESNSLDIDVDLKQDTTLSTDTVSDEYIASDVSTDSKESTTPNIKKTSYTLKSGEPVSIDVDLGSGSDAATEVVSVRREETDKELLDVTEDSAEVRYKDGKLELCEELIEEWLVDVSNHSVVLVVTFDDARATEVKVVLNK